jgi:hypothetical protein
MAIRNAGESADMKVITLNKLFGRPWKPQGFFYT